MDGVLALDLPIEEAGEFRDTLAAAGLDTIFLLSPTTTDARISPGGGARARFSVLPFRGSASPVRAIGYRPSAEALVGGSVRRRTCRSPSGFGISRPEHVAEVGAYADAAVVGSALVALIAEASAAPEVIDASSLREVAEAVAPAGRSQVRR